MEAPVAVIGGGVVGCALPPALARRGVAGVLLEAEPRLGLGASGTNSGILHNGFDSTPGELETELLLRSVTLREAVLEELAIPVLRCGALLRPRADEDTVTIRALAENAAANGVKVDRREDGALEVPGESVTDPVAYTLGLAAAAEAAGSEVRVGARVEGIEAVGEGLELTAAGGGRVQCGLAINCAGLYADAVARLVGDESFDVYPRKG